MCGYEFPGLLGHLYGVTGASPKIGLVVKDLFRSDVVFTDVGSPVAGIRHDPGKGEPDHVVIAGEFVKGMLMPVLPIGMVVQSAHYDRPAGRAAGRGRVGIQKKSAVLGEGIDGRGLGNLVAIATERRAFVIGDEENDVFLCRKKRGREGGEGKEGDEGADDHDEQVDQRNSNGQGFGWEPVRFGGVRE